MAKLSQPTLARLLLSYVPLVDYLAKLPEQLALIASFGSGSCAHETFLSHGLPGTRVHCHDVTDKYVPPYFRGLVQGTSGSMRFEFLDLEEDNASKYRNMFDLVFSIQTLEHIDNYRNFLELLAASVKPGGYLYLDAPYYHMDDVREDREELAAARKRQFEQNGHFHLGFSPTRLKNDALLVGYSLIASGYYGFHIGDEKVMKVFRRKEFSRHQGNPHFCIGLSYAMKSALDALDIEPDLDGWGYFEKPATAFRLLLRKNPV